MQNTTLTKDKSQNQYKGFPEAKYHSHKSQTQNQYKGFPEEKYYSHKSQTQNQYKGFPKAKYYSPNPKTNTKVFQRQNTTRQTPKPIQRFSGGGKGEPGGSPYK